MKLLIICFVLLNSIFALAGVSGTSGARQGDNPEITIKAGADHLIPKSVTVEVCDEVDRNCRTITYKVRKLTPPSNQKDTGSWVDGRDEGAQ